MPALATWAPEDGVLGAVAPLALAATQPTALVIDLDPDGIGYGSPRSLRDLVETGIRAEELSPARRGLAVITNGGIHPEAAAEAVELLIRGWPAVVLRMPPAQFDVPAPLVPVRLLLPGRLFPPSGRGVYQRLAGAPWRPRIDSAAGIVVPPAPRPAVQALLDGKTPRPSRWLRSWSRVWEAPW